MIKITVNVTKDCEGVLTSFPRYAEVELFSEDYEETGEGVVVVNLHSEEAIDPIERALDTNDEVISYSTETI